MAYLAAGLARSAGSGHLFRTQGQDHFQRLDPHFMDYRVHDLAGALDHVDDREQDLAIGLTELLDDGRRLLGGTRDNLVRFTQGGWLLSDSRFWSTGFYRSRPPSTATLQLRLGLRQGPGEERYTRSNQYRSLMLRADSSWASL